MNSLQLLSAAQQLKRVHQRESTAVDAALAEMELSLSLWCALDRIARNPGSSAHELAELTCLTDQSFGSLVSKLEAKGLVRRTRGAGRSIRHDLTADGHLAVEKSTPIITEVLGAEFGALSPTELDTLVSLLEKVSGTTI